VRLRSMVDNRARNWAHHGSQTWRTDADTGQSGPELPTRLRKRDELSVPGARHHHVVRADGRLIAANSWKPERRQPHGNGDLRRDRPQHSAADVESDAVVCAAL